MPMGKVIFSTPIAASGDELRVIVEHAPGTGLWTVGRVRKDKPDKLVGVDVTFGLAEFREAAIAALQGDASIQTLMNKQAGKGIAAGAVLMMLAVGISDEQIDASTARAGRAA